MAAIPPTTTKSTPWATSRRNSSPTSNSGQLASSIGIQQCPSCPVVLLLEDLEPLRRRQAEIGKDLLLVDSGQLALSRGEGDLLSHSFQSPLDRAPSRVCLAALQASDGGLGGVHPPRQFRLRKACALAPRADQLSRRHETTISDALYSENAIRVARARR